MPRKHYRTPTNAIWIVILFGNEFTPSALICLIFADCMHLLVASNRCGCSFHPYLQDFRRVPERKVMLLIIRIRIGVTTVLVHFCCHTPSANPHHHHVSGHHGKTCPAEHDFQHYIFLQRALPSVCSRCERNIPSREHDFQHYIFYLRALPSVCSWCGRNIPVDETSPAETWFQHNILQLRALPSVCSRCGHASWWRSWASCWC